MSAAVARDVCERTNSQAILQGSVAHVGQHFLLTEVATSCVDGTVLAETKQEASVAARPAWQHRQACGKSAEKAG